LQCSCCRKGREGKGGWVVIHTGRTRVFAEVTGCWSLALSFVDLAGDDFFQRAVADLARLATTSPTVMEGSEPRAHSVNRLLDHLFDYFIQDYVEGWYERMCPGDPDIARNIKQSFWVRAHTRFSGHNIFHTPTHEQCTHARTRTSPRPKTISCLALGLSESPRKHGFDMRALTLTTAKA
jgi:hypothetical protein